MNQVLSRFLIVLAVIFLLISSFSLWITGNIYDTSKFTDITMKTFEQDDVKNAASAEIIDRALQEKPIIKQVAGDTLQSFTKGLLETNLFKDLLRGATSRLHDYILKDNRQEITINTAVISNLLKPALTAIAPELANQLPQDIPTSITILDKDKLPGINKWVQPIVAVGPISGVIGIIILISLTVTAPEKKTILKRIGLYLGIGTVVFMLLVPYLKMIVSGLTSSANMNTILTQLSSNFLSILLGQLLLLLIIAIVVYLVGVYWKNITLFFERIAGGHHE